VWAEDDPRLLDTAEALLEGCFVRGGFFQDMIHSGINPYLTLHVAQVLLRAGDPRALELFETVCRLASPTGQWPEAVHPRTGGGCMGDGQHAWAAAEWVLFLRNCFVREEGSGLVLGAGLREEWLGEEGFASFGPTPTPWGPVTVEARRVGGEIEVECHGEWRGAVPPLTVQLPKRPSTLPVPASEPGLAVTEGASP
ncbi:MAG: hypothetical protein KDD47_23815, partial [Acidobacteria bacterium]|nr:hypothetical protein [Acidobacteriota bacterium]